MLISEAEAEEGEATTEVEAVENLGAVEETTTSAVVDLLEEMVPSEATASMATEVMAEAAVAIAVIQFQRKLVLLLKSQRHLPLHLKHPLPELLDKKYRTNVEKSKRIVCL